MFIQILVVDDDEAIVRVIKRYLEQASYDVLTAHDGATAMRIIEQARPDLLILDLMLPDHDGWDITRELRANSATENLPIIMLTARVEDTDMIIGLELGADDYVTKPFNARSLVARVRAILRRSYRQETTVLPKTNRLQRGKIALDKDTRQVVVADKPVALTRTEFQLLEMFMARPGHTLTRDELLEKGLGYAYTGMGRALDTHIRNLRKKIEIDPDTPEYIQTVYGIGYRFIAEAGR